MTPAAPLALNLILISLGNVGTKHMSLHGYGRSTTPGLQRWAEDAVVFEQCRTPASWTLPVSASVFTGLPPRAHGLASRFTRNRLSPAVPTLAEALASRGWDTAAFTGGLDYDPGFGHLRGFKTVGRNRNFEEIGFTVAQAERWLARRAKRPFFLFVHGYDSHCPFVADAEFRGAASGNPEPPPIPEGRGPMCGRAVESSSDGPIRLEYVADWCRGRPDCPSRLVELTPELERGMIDGYDDTLRQMDARVSGFLERLPKEAADSSIIVVYGDHGEMFSKNGRFGRLGPVGGGVFYDDVLRVPLIVKAPDLKPRRVSAPVELPALAATVLELLGAGSAPPGAAPSLAPLLRGEGPAPAEAFAGLELVHGEAEGGAAGRKKSEIDAVVEGRWKLIRETFADGRPPSLELYDLSRDPEERRNLAASRPAELERLGRLLRERRERELAAARPPATMKVREEIRRSARMFGYW